MCSRAEVHPKITELKKLLHILKKKTIETLTKLKTDVYHIDNIWSIHISDLKDYSLENDRGYRYAIVVIDNFSKFGCTSPLKNKLAQTI